ncbi:ABC transporter permease [Sulfurimonas sp. SWIR-19]|uniref:ABC transporter permease n=1 Tax=Sulfurimonas sp. SWIR-19 TaxID=2878390 RepID=UPI001CF21D03|nr:ABC transporter permease [Sulfurimonas sp. SWIR-19]UCN00602.1 ABC transporter permease [Sulfurimonas sp. SWIR-19]
MYYFKELKNFFLHILENKTTIWSLIKINFKQEYLGSYLGLFWAFAQPLTYMTVIWFVFTYGFRQGNTTNGVPFFVWLMSGMIPWFFFSAGLSGGANAVVSNAFLVKKVAFRVSILPLVKIGSALIIHLVLILFLIFALILYGYYPSVYWLQIFYYLFLMIFLLTGLGWLTSAIRVFVKDVSSFITVIIQIGFWATPIFWNPSMVPQKYAWILHINPMAYIVEGYRDSFINHIWFWQKWEDGLYFMAISIPLFILGAIVFRRLRPHFGDVL